ncbi:MAG TPA: hypothetical protein VLU25_07685 [Acidobacteriota bacterium]|nr:hypothetical protein [Acidobacteriota bacterium]
MSTAALTLEGVRRGVTSEDLDLVMRLEGLSLTAGEFHHADHVRAAWVFLRYLPLDQAMHRFREALIRFAEHVGKPGLYHETITSAYFFLIHERMHGHPDESWGSFKQRNPDLLRWKGGVLERLYSPQRLHGDLARRSFILPDAPVRPQ